MAFLGVFSYRKGTVGGGVLPIGDLLTLNGNDSIMWLDGDLEVKTTGLAPASPGDLVTQWEDQSTYDNYIGQPFFSQVYSAGTAEWNNLNYIEFDGTNGTSNLATTDEADFSALTEFTFFIVFKGNSTAAWDDGDVIASYSNNQTLGATDDGWDLTYSANGGTNELHFTYKDASATLGYNRVAFAFDDTIPMVYTFRASGDTAAAWTGNTSNPPIWTNNDGGGMDTPGGGQAFSIGSYFYLPGGINPPQTLKNSPVDIGSVVVYAGGLSDSDVKLVQNNLADKYNL